MDFCIGINYEKVTIRKGEQQNVLLQRKGDCIKHRLSIGPQIIPRV